jgi:hypothetical protein
LSRRVTAARYLALVDRMPELGDFITAFSPQPGRCFRMVYSRQLQATHCYELPVWKGIWKDRKGRSWYVELCREHGPWLSHVLTEEEFLAHKAKPDASNFRLTDMPVDG